MTCPNCNSQYNDNLSACPFCSSQPQQAPVAPQQTYAQPQQTAFPEGQQAPYQAPQGAFVAPPAPAKKKKGKLLSIIVIAIVALASIIGIINDNKEETHTFVLEQEEYGSKSSTEFELTHKGDTVTKIVMTLRAEGTTSLTDEDKDSLIASCEAEASLYEEYDFISYEYKVEDTSVYRKITINDASEHTEELLKLEIIDSDSEGDFISYKETKDSLLDDDFELVED